MRFIICGGRDLCDHADRVQAMERLFDMFTDDTVIIHGNAKGADQLAGKLAKKRGLRVEVYHADWYGLGKAAGVLRNQRMVEQASADRVYAFPGGRGTEDMVRRSRAAGIPVAVIE